MILRVRADRKSFKYRDSVTKATVKTSVVKAMESITIIKPKGCTKDYLTRVKTSLVGVKVKFISGVK